MNTATPGQIPKLEGYNEGFNQAVSTFNEIIIILLIGNIIQIFTYRLINREKPFSITIRTPLKGEIIYQKGYNTEINGKTLRAVKLVDQAVFTLNLTLTAFLFMQTMFPAYTWEVIK